MFKINKDLLPMKAHYFLYNAGVAPIQPFLPVIAKGLNFSTNAVGVMSAIMPFSGMIAKPVSGVLADRFKAHKVMFLCFQVLIIIGFFNIQFIKAIEKHLEGHVRLVCGAETNFHICFPSNNRYTECLVEDILEVAETKEVAQCFLNCNLSPEFRVQLCGPWRADPKICSETISSNGNAGEYLPSEKRNDGSYEVMNPVFSDEVLSGVKLEFKATVPLNHTLQVGNCMYFRVVDAQLNDETHHVPYCHNETHIYCRIDCNHTLISDLLKIQDHTKENLEYWDYSQFWIFLCLWICGWVGMAVVGCIADAVCFCLLGENANDYGNQRLWGSVGWGISSVMTGWIIDWFVKHHKVNYTPGFYIMLVVITFDFIVSINLRVDRTKVSSHICKDVGKLLKNPSISIFLAWCIVVGMCAGVQWTFLYWHLDDLTTCEQRDHSKILLGLVGGIQSFLGEVPSFLLFSCIVKRLGHRNLMTLILLLVGIRFILYSLLVDPWWALPIELLQSSMGLAFATMASYAGVIAPHGTEATIQGLVGAVFEGIGVSLGSYLGGIFYKTYSGAGLFQIFSTMAFLMCFIHGFINYLMSRSTNLNTQIKDFNEIARYATPNDAVSMLEDK